MFIGLRRAYRLGVGGDFEVIIWGARYKGMGPFYGGSCPLKTPCKDFNLAIAGGLGCMKWFKNGARKSLYFIQLFLH